MASLPNPVETVIKHWSQQIGIIWLPAFENAIEYNM